MSAFLRPGRWVVFAATALLLLATSGLSLSRMTCLKGGFSVYTLGVSYAECGMQDAPAAPALRAKCCTFGQVVVDQPQLQHDRIVALCVPVQHAELFGRSPLFALPMGVPNEVGDQPPPIPSSERRSLMGVYRI